MITFPYDLPFGASYAIQVARPLTEVDNTLDRLRTCTVLIALAGIGLAGGLGLIVAAQLSPVRRLTEAAENVAQTGDLSERIEVAGEDELSRLASLQHDAGRAGSVGPRAAPARRRRFARARTPLTSLRTNIEVLAGKRRLPVAEREPLMRDVVEQLDEMTTLIAELMGSRRDREPSEAKRTSASMCWRQTRLSAPAQPAGRRVQDRSTGVTRPRRACEPRARDRNLLDNARNGARPAVRWRSSSGKARSPCATAAENRRRRPAVRLRRFYRSTSARGCPALASGLRSSVRWPKRTAAP